MRACGFAAIAFLAGCTCAGGGDADDAETDAGVDAGDASADGGADAGGPLTLRAVPPTELSGLAGDPLADDCLAQTLRGDLPAEGIRIVFEVVRGGGSVFPPEGATDAGGTVATRWTLGFGGPGQILRATVDGLPPVEFTADPLPREIAFAPPVTYPAGNGPWDVAIAELGDDSGKDLVVTTHVADAIAVLPGAGDGTFGAPEPVDSVGDVRAVVVARIDGDDADDVVVVGRASDRAGVHLQDAAGVLGAVQEFPAGNAPFELAVADFGGSSALDLAVSNTTSNMVSLLVGDGAGGFELAVPFPTGAQPQGLAAALVDGDDQMDLVVAQGQEEAPGTTDDTVGVLLSDGDPSFAPFTSWLSGGGPYDVAVADVDGDDLVDAVVANGIGSSVSVLLGNGDGTFDDPIEVPLAGAPGRLVLADINGDGPLDVVVVIPLDDQVHVLRNDGSGGFGTDTSFAVGVMPRGVVVGDLNGDGMPDIVTANETSDDVTVLIRQ